MKVNRGGVKLVVLLSFISGVMTFCGEICNKKRTTKQCMPCCTSMYTMKCYKSVTAVLLHSDKEVVLLATLYKEVFAVDEVVGSDFLVESGKFLFVEAYATALGELAHFAL